MKSILLILFITSVCNVFAQSEKVNTEIVELPEVFLIGEYEDAYEDLVLASSVKLLSVCDNSLETAFANWNAMLSSMENMAEELGFDLKGIKLWLNLYWNPDGSIQHIVYYPKPNSRNINYEELTAFFVNFKRNYVLNLSSESPFSHNGMVSFPTFIASSKTPER